MLNFILGLWRQLTGEISSIVRWILSLIAAVYSYISRWVDILTSDFITVWHELESLFSAAWSFIVSVYNFARHIVDVIIHDLIVWVVRIWNDVFSFARHVYELLVSWVDFLRNLIVRVWHDIVSWVIRDIWDPLYNFVKGIIHWIDHEGALVYYYITHPDKLTALLGHWLWISWLALLKRYGKVIGRWLLVSTRGLIHDFLVVLEDIISGII